LIISLHSLLNISIWKAGWG